MILRSFTFISITLITLLIIWLAGWLWFATSISLVTTPTTAQKPEAIIVLTGGHGRVNAGLDLLEKKIAPKLFISGVNKEVSQNDILAQWQAHSDSTMGNPCCISLGYEAKDTAGNAIEIQKWVKDNNITSFLLVTSNYHMPRTYIEISKALPNTKVIRYPIISNYAKPWNSRFLYLTFKEYNKIIFIWLRLGNT